MKKLIKISSLIFFLFISGCKIEKNFSQKQKIYIEKIVNYSDQPQLVFFLSENVREIILKYPLFIIVNSEEESDYSLRVDIKKCERIPLFFSKENSDDIVGAKFNIELKLIIKEKGNLIFEKDLNDSFSFSIYKNYQEEKILNNLSEEIARKIYYMLVEMKNGSK